MIVKLFSLKMFPYNTSGIKFKIFVKETNAENPPEEILSRKYFPVTPLTGDKAKEFYESILKESTCEGKKIEKPKPKIKQSVKKMQIKTFKNSDLLSMAQNNEMEKLNEFFAQPENKNVNIVDDFGWTPLMCASCSGAVEAVEILLENGADPFKCDKLGNTALKLAKQKNHKRIVEMLENFESESNIVEVDEYSPGSVETFFCSNCKENLTMNKQKHESSTLHLFNSQIKTSTFYGIPECNKGFQLLLREGWDKEKGLGPDGTGRKFPVKAVMKKDRRGIGASPPPVNNKRETQHTVKYESKRRQTYKKWKEKNFEKNFRLEFS